jgi:7-carboxy-7-deazaguanine synthase
MAYIHSIYPATEGEGVRIGTAQVFVRFQGCAVGCQNCDSRETWQFKTGHHLTVDQICQQVLSYNLDWSSITGGDPLDSHHRTDVADLIRLLKQTGQQVNIEVTGQQIDDEIFELVDFISFDIKTPSTGVSSDVDLVQALLEEYEYKTQIKCVIQDEKDFNYAYGFYKVCCGDEFATNWVMTPAASEVSPLSMKMFERVLELNQREGAKFRVIGQQHKWIFGSGRLDI